MSKENRIYLSIQKTGYFWLKSVSKEGQLISKERYSIKRPTLNLTNLSYPSLSYPSQA